MPLPDLDYEPTIPAVVRRAATAFGDNDFIVMPDRRMTYAEAEVASRRVGKQLLAAGVGKGTRIGFMFPYGTDWVVAWLAIAADRRGRDAVQHVVQAGRAAQGAAASATSTRCSCRRPCSVRITSPTSNPQCPGSPTAGPEPLRIPALPYLRHVCVSGPSDRLWAKALRPRLPARRHRRRRPRRRPRAPAPRARTSATSSSRRSRPRSRPPTS